MNSHTGRIVIPMHSLTTRSVRLCATVAILTFLFAASASGQLFQSFGIMGGPVLANQRWDYTSPLGFTDIEHHPLWGFDLGVSSELFSIPYITADVELHYIQKGRTITEMITEPANNEQGFIDLGKKDIRQRFSYLSVPLLVKFGIDLGSVKPFVSLGPSLEFLIDHPSSPVYDKFHKTEFDGTFALGTEISPGFLPAFSVEVRYIFGVTDSYQNDNLKVKTEALAFLLGFPLY